MSEDVTIRESVPYTYQVLTMGYGWVSEKSGYVPAVKEGL